MMISSPTAMLVRVLDRVLVRREQRVEGHLELPAIFDSVSPALIDVDLRRRLGDGRRREGRRRLDGRRGWAEPAPLLAAEAEEGREEEQHGAAARAPDRPAIGGTRRHTRQAAAASCVGKAS